MKLLRLLFRHLSPAGPRGRLAILIFHRVHLEPDPLFPGEASARWFDELLASLRVWFNVLPLDEAVAMRAEGRLPERAAAITFDDGYADNHAVAVPLLRRHGLCASFFVASGFLDGGRMWNDSVIEAIRRCSASSLDLTELRMPRLPVSSVEDKRRAIEHILNGIKYLPPAERNVAVSNIVRLAGVSLPNDLMMRSEDVLAISRAGMGVGAHTVSHPILATLDATEAEREIAEGRRALANIVGAPIRLFAYPNGRPAKDYLDRDVDIVRRLGFDAAVSTRPAIATGPHDRFELPRFTPWDRTMTRFGARMARAYAAA